MVHAGGGSSEGAKSERRKEVKVDEKGRRQGEGKE